METHTLSLARTALVAVKRSTGDALAACRRPARPTLMRVTRTELAHDVKRLMHFELCHYLRTSASPDALLLVRQSVEQTLCLLDAGDERLTAELEAVAPYRHRLYAAATSIALITAEREELRLEQEYWRQRNRMRIVPTRTVCGEIHKA